MSEGCSGSTSDRDVSVANETALRADWEPALVRLSLSLLVNMCGFISVSALNVLSGTQGWEEGGGLQTIGGTELITREKNSRGHNANRLKR